MKPTELKLKTCVICKQQFPLFKTTQKVCSIKCAGMLAIKQREKEEALEAKRQRLELRERKKKLKKLSEWLKDVEYWFNKFIRLRDAHLPCISCETCAPVVYAAGHFRTVKAASHLRFNEDNVNKQCNSYCNKHLSGNLLAYRRGLIAKIGVERVEALENDNRLHTYTAEECQQLIAHYKAKCKELLTREGD